MASPAAVLQVFVNANTKVASAQLAAFDRQLSGVGKTSAATGGSMGKFTKGAAAAGAGIAAFGAVAVVAGKQLYDLGAQFDEAYDTIRVRTGATGRELDRLKGSFKSVAKEVPNNLAEVGVAIGDLNTRLGLTGKPLERMAESMLNLSNITGDDLEGNIKAVSRSFVDWEVTIPKQTRYLDGMFRVSQASGASISELADSVQKFGSPLRQLGFEFDEAISMFASFERAGVNTQTMVPGLKLAISNLTRPTETLAEQMAKLGIEAGKPDVALRRIFKLLGTSSNLSQIEKTGLAMDVFGKRAGADMAEAIKQGRFELDRFLKIFRDNQGDSIQKASADTRDLSENLAILKNRLSVLVEPLAMGLFNALGNVSRVLANLDFSRLNTELISLPTGAVKLRDALGFLNTRFLESIPVVGQFVGAVKLVGQAINGLKGLFGKDDETPFQERLARSAQAIRDVSQAGMSSVQALAKQTDREEGLRKRSQAAAQRAKRAEENFIAARKRFGPASQQAVTAEAKYHLALQKSERLKERVAKAERLSGAVRRATQRITESSVTTLKAEIFQNERLINKKGQQVELEQRKETPSKKRIARLSREIIDLSRNNATAQDRVNRLIQRAGSEIGPRVARSLERMSGRTAMFKQTLGTLPGPITKVGNTTEREFQKASKSSDRFADASEKTRRRVNQANRAMPPVVEMSTGQMMKIFKNRVEALDNLGKPRVSRRKGGRIPHAVAHFERGGLVPAAVSPGEMISYGSKQMIVPGRPEPRDSVLMGLPAGARVFTWDGQARLMMGQSEDRVLREQAPHFAAGGIVKPKILGGSTKANQHANKAIDGVHSRAKDWLDRIAKAVRSSFSGASGQYPGVSGDTDFKPALGRALSKMARASGQSIYVQSGWRSYAEQAALYQAYLNGTGNLAAPPGSSNHESGRAADITPGSEVFGAMAGRFGLGFTVPSESWHIELLRRGGRVRGALNKFRKGGFVGNINRIWNERNSGYGDWGGPTLPSYVVAALAQAAGMPGVTMEQVTRGESGAHAKGTARPGATGIDPGGTKGHGLWMITSGYNEDLAAKVGGWNKMLNPVINAWAASQIYRRQGLGAWYGTGSVTGDGIRYTGNYDISKALGGLSYRGALHFSTDGALGEKPKSIGALIKGAAKAIQRVAELRGKYKGAKGFLNAAVGNAKEAKNLAKDGEVTKARERLDKAREQIRSAVRKGSPIKPNKPSQGKPGGGKAPEPTTPVDAIIFPERPELEQNRKAIDIINERIDLFERDAGAPWSPGGSEYDQNEINGLTDLYEFLLHSYERQRSLVVGEINYLTARIEDRRRKITEIMDNITNWRYRIDDLQAKILEATQGEQVKKWRARVTELEEKLKKGGTPQQKKAWREELDNLRGKLGDKAKNAEGWREKIGEIRGWIKNANDVDLPAYFAFIEDAQGQISDTLSPELENLQGVTGEGGLISDTRWELLNLANLVPWTPAPPDSPEDPAEPGDPGTTPPDSPSESQSAIAEILRQQLFETQKALAIANAQMPIFKQFLPTFHTGGVVQGPFGAERPVMAQAGEGIFTREQMAAMSPTPNVTVIIEDGAIDKSKIRVEVDGVLADKISSARRQIPGRSYASR